MARATAKTKKTITKSAPTKLSKSSTKTPVQKQAADQPATNSSTPPLKVRKAYVIAIIVIILLGLFLFVFRGLFVAAVVNGQPISRLRVVQETEKQSGKQALNVLVRNALIEQEAQKEHVTVSDQEVNDEIKKVQTNLSQQGQKLDQVLAMQGMTQSDLRDLIRLQKLVDKMIGKNIKISDKQVNDYIDKNKDMLPKGQSDAQMKQTVKAQLTQQELNTKVQTWLGDLQTKAHTIYFVQY